MDDKRSRASPHYGSIPQVVICVACCSLNNMCICMGSKKGDYEWGNVYLIAVVNKIVEVEPRKVSLGCKKICNVSLCVTACFYLMYQLVNLIGLIFEESSSFIIEN